MTGQAASTDAVRFENVGLRYGQGPEVLRDISFSLAAGSFHFLTGLSGAGKSSLLRLIWQEQRPSRGLVHLFGQDMTTIPRRQMPAIRRRIGVMFQDFRLLDHLSVFENVALPLIVAGRKPDSIRADVLELIAWVGLEGLAEARPATLSGGQQQRVAIARAVVGRPRVLLADEPTGNVDEGMGVKLIWMLQELNRLGTTIIVATHNEGLIRRFPHPQLHLTDGVLTTRPAPREAA